MKQEIKIALLVLGLLLGGFAISYAVTLPNVGGVQTFSNFQSNTSTSLDLLNASIGGFTGTFTAGAAISITSSSPTWTFVNEGVRALVGSTHLGISSATGTVTLTNEGVRALTAGRSVTTDTATGSISISADEETYDASFGYAMLNATSTSNVGKLLTRAMTITKVICQGSDATNTINVVQRESRFPNASGTAVLSSALTCATTSSASSTTFTDATVPADTWLFMVATTTGNETYLNLTVQGTFDD